MKAISIFLCAVVLVCSAEKPLADSQIATFYSGLVQGLQLNSTEPGPCAGALAAAQSDVNAFVSDFLQMVLGDEKAVTYFLLDGKDVFGDFQASGTVCNWKSLGSALQALTTSAGQATLVQSFTANLGTFLLDFQQLALCGSQWNSCGFALGELLRMTLSWGIN